MLVGISKVEPPVSRFNETPTSINRFAPDDVVWLKVAVRLVVLETVVTESNAITPPPEPMSLLVRVGLWTNATGSTRFKSCTPLVEPLTLK